MNQPQRLAKQIARRLFMSMRDPGRFVYSFEMWSKADLVRKGRKRDGDCWIRICSASFQSHPFLHEGGAGEEEKKRLIGSKWIPRNWVFLSSIWPHSGLYRLMHSPFMYIYIHNTDFTSTGRQLGLSFPAPLSALSRASHTRSWG